MATKKVNAREIHGPLEEIHMNNDGKTVEGQQEPKTNADKDGQLELVVPKMIGKEGRIIEKSVLAIAVDEEDKYDPFSCSEYVDDIYYYLMDSEQKSIYTLTGNFIKNQTKVTSQHRSVLVDWLILVQRKFKLHQETLYITIDIMDRYLNTYDIPKNQLQLIGITSMMVACKYEEIYPPEITDFVYICADTYTKKQIIDMEKRLLMALCHDLNKPTQLEFLRRYSKITMTNSREHAMAKYLLEQGLLECNLSRERPSVKAAAAVILAKSIIQHKMISCNILKAYTGYSEGNLQEMAVRLKECMICYHHNHKFTAVKKKYETIQYLEIANSRELRKISQL